MPGSELHVRLDRPRRQTSDGAWEFSEALASKLTPVETLPSLFLNTRLRVIGVDCRPPSLYHRGM